MRDLYIYPLLFILLIPTHSAGSAAPVVLVGSSYLPHGPIEIVGNGEFLPGNGVVAGNGSLANPYTIQGWDITPPSGKCTSSDGTSTCTVPSGSGIMIHNTTAFVIIRDVRIHSGGINSCGICMGNVTNVMLENSTLSDNYHGIVILSSSSLSIMNNSLTNNSLEIQSSLGAILENNQASNSTLWIDQSSSTRVLNNWVQEGGIGITSTNNATISGNTIIDSWNGPAVFVRYSEKVQFYGNNVIDGGRFQTFVMGGSQNAWDRGYPAGGNYWSDYNGVDRCTGAAQNVCTGPDGIGDTPYEISINNYDRYPLMKPENLASVSAKPTWPAGARLVAAQENSTSVYLVWNVSPDSLGIIRYRVSINDRVFAVTRVVYSGAFASQHLASLLANGLRAGSTYTFKVEAGNPSGNWSQPLSQTLTLNQESALIASLPAELAAVGLFALVVFLGVIGLRRNRRRTMTPGQDVREPTDSPAVSTKAGPPPEFV